MKKKVLLTVPQSRFVEAVVSEVVKKEGVIIDVPDAMKAINVGVPEGVNPRKLRVKRRSAVKSSGIKTKELEGLMDIARPISREKQRKYHGRPTASEKQAINEDTVASTDLLAVLEVLNTHKGTWFTSAELSERVHWNIIPVEKSDLPPKAKEAYRKRRHIQFRRLLRRLVKLYPVSVKTDTESSRLNHYRIR